MELAAVLVGCGAMSRAWLQAAAKFPDLRIVGLADLDVDRAKERATEFSLKDAVIARDVHALIAESRPDLVFDVVVPSARHEVVSASLEAGCHVLSEKPMAETLADARDLVHRAKAAGRIHAVVQNRRYLAGVRRIARALRSGAIGPITSVHADFFLAPHFGGFREDMDHVLLLDMAIHSFDALRCMTGLTASGVYCREWNPPHSWYRQGASAAAIFDLDNGAVFVYRGSLCNAPDPAARVRKIVELGFESIEPFFWQTANKDLPVLGTQLREAIGGADVTIDTLGMFGNPLEDGDLERQTLAGWVALIDNAHHFGARTIAGFTGRLRNQPIEASLPQFKTVWGELSRRAADRGVRLAFENCAMNGNWASGDWNIAHSPDAWELMFNAVPADNLGLEWEPCHQLVYLIDPVPQIRKWAKKFFHVHGKDATVRWDVVREHGVFGKYPFVQMRTPGFGDTDWTRVISELRLAGYSGTIDIEGWHDPVYRDAMEMTGQVRALQYLKQCRGGLRQIANPAWKAGER